jgi:hypothetical protein
MLGPTASNRETPTVGSASVKGERIIIQMPGDDKTYTRQPSPYPSGVVADLGRPTLPIQKDAIMSPSRGRLGWAKATKYSSLILPRVCAGLVGKGPKAKTKPPVGQSCHVLES